METSSPADARRGRGGTQRGETWVWLLPAVVAIALYLPALRDGFALDDVPIIATDRLLHRLPALAAVLARPYWYDKQLLYRPLTTLAFALEWAAGGGTPVLFHAVNIGWHATVAGLVARVTQRWWSPLAAAAAGVWFAVTPVHAEAVVNIVGRSELVCGAALLMLVLLATRPASRGAATAPTDAPDRRPGDAPGDAPGSGRAEWWTAFALAAAAMASKETGVVAPAVVWAAAITPMPGEEGEEGKRRRRAWRLAHGAAAAVVALLIARWLVLGRLGGDDPHYAFRLAGPAGGTLLALATVPRAVALLAFPQPPRLDYSPPDAVALHPDPTLVALGALLVIAAVLTLARHARRPTPWGAIASLSLLTYLPVSNLLFRTGVVLADRTLYSPSVAVAAAAGAAFALCTGTREARPARGTRGAWTAWPIWPLLRRRVPGAAAVATGWVGARRGPAAGLARLRALLLAAPRAVAPTRAPTRTLARTLAGTFAVALTGVALVGAVTAVTAIGDRSPSSFIGHYMCAEAADDSGHVAAAGVEYAAAVALAPHHASLLYRAGANALRRQDTALAHTLLARAVGLDPGHIRARAALAALDLRAGDTTTAVSLLRDGLARDSTQRTWRIALHTLGR